MDRLARFLRNTVARDSAPAIVHGGVLCTYGELDRKRISWIHALDEKKTRRGEIVGIEAGFSPESVGLLLALLSRGNVAALLPRSAPNRAQLLADAGAGSLWKEEGTTWSFDSWDAPEPHPLTESLFDQKHSGFVIFSSGSTGRAKAILHDAERFLSKFEKPGKGLRTVAFLLFDHIAGLDTLFYTMAYGGCLIFPESREPHSVARLMEAHRAQVLPASPTFLKLFLLSHAYEGCDLGSLEIITYGSEPMPQETLDRLREVFPSVRLLQKYGTSELGSPRSKSQSDGSLWLNFKQDGLQTKIVDGVLWLRSDSAMVGYLNAPNPFDAHGWFCTEDRVEADGDWIRVLGRDSELINVGGEKVFPQEVEEVIAELDWVRDVVVRGARNALMGQVVEAVLNVERPCDSHEARRLVRSHCRGRLPAHKIPVSVVVTEEPLTSERHKKRRRQAAAR